MTTIAVNGKEYQLDERKEPKFVEFKSDGNSVQGILIGIEKITKDGKLISRYVVDDPSDGLLYSFLGTYVIDQKIRPSDRGKFIVVRFAGEDKTIGGDKGNKMKLFDVMVSRSKVDGAENLVITDSDLPF